MTLKCENDLVLVSENPDSRAIYCIWISAFSGFGVSRFRHFTEYMYFKGKAGNYASEFFSKVKFVHLNPLEFESSSIDHRLLLDPITSLGYNEDATMVRVSRDLNPNSFEMEKTYKIGQALTKICNILKDLHQHIGQTLVLNFRYITRLGDFFQIGPIFHTFGIIVWPWVTNH